MEYVLTFRQSDDSFLIKVHVYLLLVIHCMVFYENVYLCSIDG